MTYWICRMWLEAEIEDIDDAQAADALLKKAWPAESQAMWEDLLIEVRKKDGLRQAINKEFTTTLKDLCKAPPKRGATPLDPFPKLVWRIGDIFHRGTARVAWATEDETPVEWEFTSGLKRPAKVWMHVQMRPVNRSV
jgi:hypothetical protein